MTGHTCSQALKKGGGKLICHSQHINEKNQVVFYGFWKIIKEIDGGDNYDGAVADMTATYRINYANMTSCMQISFMLIICFGGKFKKVPDDCGNASPL